MAQPHGVTFKPEKRKELSLMAWRLFQELTAKGEKKTPAYECIAALLDISIPTARNMVARGRRLAYEGLMNEAKVEAGF